MKITIIYKEQSPACELAEEITAELKERGIEAAACPARAEALRWREKAAAADMVMVLGGDGTILNSARELAGSGIPLLGINFGKIGFLSSIKPEEWPQARDKMLQHQYQIEKRMMLQAEVVRNGEPCCRGQALNDAVIRTRVLHTITINLALDGEPYASYRGDGVICATPTGSTAYSYSAGGPVLHPQLEALAVTPVCPQLSSARSLVVPAATKLEFTIAAGHPALMALDGQEAIEVKPADRIKVSKAPHSVDLVQIKARSSMEKIMQSRNKVQPDR